MPAALSPYCPGPSPAASARPSPVQLAVVTSDRVVLRSRRGTDMTPAFPDIRAAAVDQLPVGTALDGVM
ncbi:hypothetical protein [Streptomyces sp. GbtcB6]|uniref:hypothetical protein n=1 Tax=Streptomyces sp. GbtcB6 TaxID=2824751 RepID=UPI001C30B739|nr:hypothetical protein [Streptomyces sp. GbtcB6]